MFRQEIGFRSEIFQPMGGQREVGHGASATGSIVEPHLRRTRLTSTEANLHRRLSRSQHAPVIEWAGRTGAVDEVVAGWVLMAGVVIETFPNV
jgi:hypothetical protein